VCLRGCLIGCLAGLTSNRAPARALHEAGRILQLSGATGPDRPSYERLQGCLHRWPETRPHSPNHLGSGVGSQACSQEVGEEKRRGRSGSEMELVKTEFCGEVGVVRRRQSW
jgi:hypothetical protein